MKLIKQDKPPLRIQPANTSLAKVKVDTWIEDKYTALKGLDVTCLGTGHISCPRCHHNFFGVDVDKVNCRVRIGCHKCGTEQVLLFPVQGLCQLPPGVQSCPLGHNQGFALIKSDETFCIGCRHCNFEFRTKVFNDPTKIFIV